MSKKKPCSWECKACTWVNENEHGLACLMCQTERRIASPRMPKNRGGAAQTSAPGLNAPDAVKKSVSCSKDSDMARRGDDSFHSRHCDETEPSTVQLSRGEKTVAESLDKKFEATEESETDKRKTAEGGNRKWDAFASLENNYQSSDDDESETFSGRERSGGGSDNGNGKMGNDAGGNQWDAFQSLEQNYESSEEEYDISSDEDSEEREVGMGENGAIEVEGDDHPSLNKQNGKKYSNPDVEYVDLVDSDEDSVCELDVKMPGKENNKTDKQSSRRKRPQKHEAYTIDGDSESSLSEVESRRPLPSPSARSLPPWQRRRSASTPNPYLKTSTSTPIRTDDNLKTSDSFSCMSGRNDVIGGSGAGVNGFRLSNRKGDDSKDTAVKRKSRKSLTSAASGASSQKANASASAPPKTKKRKRTVSKTTASKATASKAAAPARKRKKKSYKRSTKRSTKGRRNSTCGMASNNNAWSARERGIRQPYRRGGGESAPYMAIAKQEPMLRNVGGASIQF
mmetsp:Transcript_41969/g.75608  ORF Transcript_41969/g.75608 Transcript_41969/m.75608 type:complete len:511 (-) Transcript_41969:132-1664(-)